MIYCVAIAAWPCALGLGIESIVQAWGFPSLSIKLMGKPIRETRLKELLSRFVFTIEYSVCLCVFDPVNLFVKCGK